MLNIIKGEGSVATTATTTEGSFEKGWRLADSKTVQGTTIVTEDSSETGWGFIDARKGTEHNLAPIIREDSVQRGGGLVNTEKLKGTTVE